MRFTKLQGTGNDFVLVESESDRRNWSSLAQALCDRHFGVGADGLLVLLPSSSAGFRMREFNADGSEAEACGNGLRCVARYIAERGLVSQTTSEVSIETLAGTRQARLQRSDGRVSLIQVGMGEPRFAPKEVPVTIETGKLVDRILTDATASDLLFEGMFTGRSPAILLSDAIAVDGTSLKLYFVSMGNPHAVHFWPKPVADFPLLQLGPKVEHHQIFPRRVNFEVARVLSRREIEVRVWERGVGETLACGSGACAVAVAAQLLGYTDEQVSIRLPGGSLEIEWDGSGEVLLTGPAEIVFTGEWPD